MHADDDDELADQHGRSIRDRLLLWDGSRWFAKRGAAWPELLAYRLGSLWLNVADTLLPEDVPQEVRNSIPWGTAEIGNGVLVRLGQDHNFGELPIQELNKAIAAELVFSLWIRRRDPSPWNRAYIDGVPVFFDFHVAFDCEPDNMTLDGFFRKGDDGGYPSNWRVRELESVNVPTTCEERLRCPKNSRVTIHHVRDLTAFEEAMDAAAELILRTHDADVLLQAMLAGVPHARQMADFLQTTKVELPAALQRLREVIYRPVNGSH